MLPDRDRRLQQLGQTESQWATMGDLTPGDFKVGHGVDAFVHVGRTQAQLKTKGAHLALGAQKTVLNPGETLRVPIHFARMQFAAHSFNPLATEASSAVFPVPTFVETPPILDPDLKALTGMIGILESLRRAVS